MTPAAARLIGAGLSALALAACAAPAQPPPAPPMAPAPPPDPDGPPPQAKPTAVIGKPAQIAPVAPR